MIERLVASSLVRFGFVAVAGLVVDLATAWSLATAAGLPLPLAAFFGFCAGAAFNYLLHERWTFGTGKASARRGALYLAALLVTLAVRVGLVALLETTVLDGERQRLPILLLATGGSFTVNYLLSRFVVFRPDGRERTVLP